MFLCIVGNDCRGKERNERYLANAVVKPDPLTNPNIEPNVAFEDT